MMHIKHPYGAGGGKAHWTDASFLLSVDTPVHPGHTCVQFKISNTCFFFGVWEETGAPEETHKGTTYKLMQIIYIFHLRPGFIKNIN